MELQGGGIALGYRLQTGIDGSQRLVRDFDIAPRWFGAEPGVPISETWVQPSFEITVGSDPFGETLGSPHFEATSGRDTFGLTEVGQLTTPGVETPTYTRAYELGADVREMIETGNLRQRTLGRGVAGVQIVLVVVYRVSVVSQAVYGVHQLDGLHAVDLRKCYYRLICVDFFL